VPKELFVCFASGGAKGRERTCGKPYNLAALVVGTEGWSRQALQKHTLQGASLLLMGH